MCVYTHCCCCCCCCCCVTSVVSDSVRLHRRQPTRLPRPWDCPGKNTGVGCHFLLQCMKVKSLSCVRLFVTPWTAAYQVPWSMGFSRQEYWSGVPSPSPIVVSNFIQLCSNLCYIPFSTNLLTLTFIYLFFFLFICDVKFGCLFETYLVS